MLLNAVALFSGTPSAARAVTEGAKRLGITVSNMAIVAPKDAEETFGRSADEPTGIVLIAYDDNLTTPLGAVVRVAEEARVPLSLHATEIFIPDGLEAGVADGLWDDYMALLDLSPLSPEAATARGALEKRQSEAIDQAEAAVRAWALDMGAALGGLDVENPSDIRSVMTAILKEIGSRGADVPAPPETDDVTDEDCVTIVAVVPRRCLDDEKRWTYANENPDNLYFYAATEGISPIAMVLGAAPEEWRRLD